MAINRYEPSAELERRLDEASPDVKLVIRLLSGLFQHLGVPISVGRDGCRLMADLADDALKQRDTLLDEIDTVSKLKH